MTYFGYKIERSPLSRSTPLSPKRKKQIQKIVAQAQTSMAPGHYIATPQGRTQLIHDATDKKALLEQVHALSHQLQKELNYFDNTPSSIAETAVNTPTDQPSVITAAGKQIVTESLTNAATKTATGASTADTVQTGTSVEHSNRPRT